MALLYDSFWVEYDHQLAEHADAARDKFEVAVVVAGIVERIGTAPLGSVENALVDAIASKITSISRSGRLCMMTFERRHEILVHVELEGFGKRHNNQK